jgi:hypothetical protein
VIEEAATKLALLLKGRVPEPIDAATKTNQAEPELAVQLNRLFTSVREIHEFIVPLSKGQLEQVKVPPPKNFFASPFKELHSHLQHLTWQVKQVAQGDYTQRVDFMGDFSEAFNSMIVALSTSEEKLKRKIDELQKALSLIATLEGILPICASCKKIRLEGTDPKTQNSWVQVEHYISDRTKAQFSHSICPCCLEKLFPEAGEPDAG